MATETNNVIYNVSFNTEGAEANLKDLTTNLTNVNKEVKSTGSSFDNLGATVSENTAQVVDSTEKIITTQKELRKVVRDMSLQMQQAFSSGNQKLAGELGIKIAKVKDNFKDLQAQIMASNPETFFSNAAKAANGLVGAFAGLSAAANLFGSESKQLQEIEKKSIQLIQLMIALEQVAEMTRREGAIMGLKYQVQSIALRIKEALTINAVNASTKAGIVLTRLWNTIIAANPIGLIIAGVALLAGAIYLLRDRVKELSLEQSRQKIINEDNLKMQKKVAENYATEQTNLLVIQTRLKDTNLKQKDRNNLIDEINTKYGTYLPNLLTHASSEKQIADAIDLVRIALLKRAKAQAAEEQITEIFKERNLVEIEYQRRLRQQEILQKRINTLRNTPNITENQKRELSAFTDALGTINYETRAYAQDLETYDIRIKNLLKNIEIIPENKQVKNVTNAVKVLKTELEKPIEVKPNNLKDYINQLVDAWSDLDFVKSTLGKTKEEIEKLQNEFDFNNIKAKILADETLTTPEKEQLLTSWRKYYDEKNKLIKGDEEKKNWKDYAEAVKTIIDEINSALDSYISKQQEAIDKQKERVAQARDDVEKGKEINARIIQLEQERLDKLEEQKRKSLEVQKALAITEIAVNTAIAVSKAASEQGIYGALAIIAAIAAGIAASVGVASSVKGFKKGGYTGDKGVDEVAGVIHGKEFVVDAEMTAKNRPILEMMHKTRKPLASIMENMVINMQGATNKKIIDKLEKVELAIKSQGFGVNIDSKGFTGYINHLNYKNERIRNR